jgi:aspartyl protease family protein
MMSSGVRNLMRMVGGWALALTLALFAVVNFEEIRERLGLRLTPEDLGVRAEADRPAPPEPEVKTVIRYIDRPAEGSQRRAQGASRRAAGDDNIFAGFDTARGGVTLQRGRDGHFRADAEINGRPVGVLVDTGATVVALSYEDAAAAGISVQPGDFRHVSQTANGPARFARVTLNQVRIGDIVVHDVAAAVGEPGRLHMSLLGMSFLGRLRMEMKGSRLLLEQ